MLEFYPKPFVGYQNQAQPMLNAIAKGLLEQRAVGDFLLKGTALATAYRGATLLWKEQKEWCELNRNNKASPFWANYFCSRDRDCQCRVSHDSKALETDAIFLLRAPNNRILAMHIEMKTEKEALIPGQAESYPLRAECFKQKAKHNHRYINMHDDCMTILFCGSDIDKLKMLSSFDRVITHDDARNGIDGYSVSN